MELTPYILPIELLPSGRVSQGGIILRLSGTPCHRLGVFGLEEQVTALYRRQTQWLCALMSR